jgi:hypothetical protein
LRAAVVLNWELMQMTSGACQCLHPRVHGRLVARTSAPSRRPTADENVNPERAAGRCGDAPEAAGAQGGSACGARAFWAAGARRWDNGSAGSTTRPSRRQGLA